MISFENFMMQDGIPIYIQILMFIKRGIIGGRICDGDELPSRRMLSALLGVNPNTIQKAYAELERQGVIYSLAGRGNFVSSDTSSLKDEHHTMLLSAIAESVEQAAAYGIGESEIIAAVKAAYENNKGGNRE